MIPPEVGAGPGLALVDRMNRLALLPVLALTLAASALGQGTDYAIQGMDARRGSFRGTLTVTPRADRRFDVSLTTRFGAETTVWTGAVAGKDGHSLEGEVTDGRGATGVLAGLGLTKTRFSATFDLRTGAVQGSRVRAFDAAAFWGSRPGAAEPAGEAYEAGSPASKQAAVWREARALPYGELPRLGSRGVGESVWDSISALRLGLLDKTFAQASDIRPPRTKIFHPFGSVAQVGYEARPGHRFTGLFATGGAGLARLSLATDAETFIPGIALKLFVAGKPSVNIHAIPSFEPQESKDFFLRAPSNEIPPPTAVAIKLFSKLASRIADPLHRPVDHVAAVKPDGSVVESPVAPHRIHFRPAGVHFPANSTKDFRELLATIPVGTVIYAVHAETPQGEVHIGDVRLLSPLVASEWGDRVLHFKHER